MRLKYSSCAGIRVALGNVDSMSDKMLIRDTGSFVSFVQHAERAIYDSS